MPIAPAGAGEAKKERITAMHISIALFVLALVIAVFVGFWACALFCSRKIEVMQGQVDAKLEVWCKDCDYLQRLTDCNEKLAGRDSYVKSLEDRISTLTRSNRQLGLVVQKKSWGRV